MIAMNLKDLEIYKTQSSNTMKKTVFKIHFEVLRNINFDQQKSKIYFKKFPYPSFYNNYMINVFIKVTLFSKDSNYNLKDVLSIFNLDFLLIQFNKFFIIILNFLRYLKEFNYKNNWFYQNL